MADITERLRDHIGLCRMRGEPPCVRCTAASTIELLRVDVEQAELRIAALQATIAGLHAKVRRR